MRRLITLFVLFCAVPLWAAQYEIRSERIVLTIEATEAGADTALRLHVRDAASGATLFQETLTLPPHGAAQREAEAAGRRIFLRVTTLTGRTLNVALQVHEGDTVVDTLNGSWSMAAVPKLRSAGALRVGGDVKPPVLVSRVEPHYPAEAREKRMAGIVIVEAVIGSDGAVRDAVALKPLPFGLTEAALEAVRQWKFQPGTLNGNPVDVLYNLTVNFLLPDE